MGKKKNYTILDDATVALFFMDLDNNVGELSSLYRQARELNSLEGYKELGEKLLMFAKEADEVAKQYFSRYQLLRTLSGNFEPLSNLESRFADAANDVLLVNERVSPMMGDPRA